MDSNGDSGSKLKLDTDAEPESTLKWDTDGDSGYTLESDTDGLQACMLGFHLSSSSLGRVVLSIKQELKLNRAIFIETASKVFGQFLFELPFLFIVHSTKRHYYLRVPMIKYQIKGFPNKKAHYLLVFETTTVESYN